MADLLVCRLVYCGYQNFISSKESGGSWDRENDVNQTASLGLTRCNDNFFWVSRNTVNHLNQGDNGACGSADWGTNSGKDSIW